MQSKRAVRNGEHRLPPHSVEAEQGVLGCVLLEPGRVLAKVMETVEAACWFYEARHQEIFLAIQGLYIEGTGVDCITVCNALKERGRLDQVGGLVYLTELETKVPSALNVEHYLQILSSKYQARVLVGSATDIVGEVFEQDGLDEALITRAEERFEDWRALTRRTLDIEPRHNKRPMAFREDFLDRCFGAGVDDYGKKLPFEFPVRIRPKEFTLFIGENGSGKSSMLSMIALWFASQVMEDCFVGRNRVWLASMEQPAEVTLWIAARQLTGLTGKIADNEENRELLERALKWLDEYFIIYDFLGIADKREVLESFKYACTHQGVGLGIIDSIMRLGIAEDDYAAQALASKQFANVAMETGSHLIAVNHTNKSEGTAKRRSSGTMKWADNADVMIEIQKNEKKSERLEDSREKLRLAEESVKMGDMRQEDFDELLGKHEALERKCEGEHDTAFRLHKQRFAGSRQNGAKYLFFDFGSLQFRAKHYDTKAVCYIDKWAPAERESRI